jgi:antitoxin ParD1/3/4
MTISLTPDQLAWLKAHVERGEFPSIDEAARQLIDERIAERMAEETDDLAWAKPEVEAALAELMAGNVLSRAEHEARTEAQFRSTKA